MKKAFLVALREYHENLRTKTFWVGILFFPIILVLSVLVPKLLSDVKDVRRFAVLDRSAGSWVLAEVENRAAMPDLEKVYRHLLAIGPDSASARRFPESLRETARALAAIPEERRDEALRGMARGVGELGEDQLARLEALAGSAAVEVLRAHREEVRDWYRRLSPEDAEDFGSPLVRSRYQRVELPGATEEELREKVDSGDLFAFFVVGDDLVESNDNSYYVSNNRTDDGLRSWFTEWAEQAVRAKRFETEDVAPEVVARIQKPVRFERKTLDSSAVGGTAEVTEQEIARDWAPVAFVYLLWISVFMISQMLLTNTIEEKSNRIIEVLLSSVSPGQLMGGKIAGIAATGLTIVASWMLVIWIAIRFVLPWTDTDFPVDLGFIVKDPVYLTSFLVYFLLGYLFYAALLCGIGSVCNSLKEAQNLMTPVTVLLMMPLFAMFPVAMDPNGTLARFLSYVPPLTPFVMMNRAAGPPSPAEYLGTTVLLVASIAVLFWGAAKIFRVGILMTGKPPRLREILRWLRAPVGDVPPRP